MPVCYTLECEDGCYYVGLTETWQSLGTRMSYHFSGRGSSWSKLHPPLRLIEAVEGNKATEQKRTIALMKEKGWMKVRGGNYTQVYMRQPKWWRPEEHVDVSTKKSVDRMIATSEAIKAFHLILKSIKKVEGLQSEGPAAGGDDLVDSSEDEGEYLSDD